MRNNEIFLISQPSPRCTRPTGSAGILCKGVLMAHYARSPVLSVDYRMPPDHPFPAALNDAVAVWQQLLEEHAPQRMAVFGASACGGRHRAVGSA